MSNRPQRLRATLKLADAEIYYEVTGPNATGGPAMVFAHGLGGNHMSWWQQVPHFSQRHTCVTFAHRGFTPSRELGEPRGPQAFPDDLAALLDHLKLDRVVLVAQSMGGWSCLPFAIRAPERVRGLVMACTGGGNYRNIEGLKIDGLAEREKWAAAEMADYERDGIHPAGGRKFAGEQPGLHFLYRAVDDLTPQAFKQGMRQRLFAAPPPTLEALRGLKVPTLFMVGERDVVFPPPVADAMARVMPSARVERFDAGHSIYFERPDAFNAALERFVNELASH